jgi:fatty acid desaturase
MDAYAYRYLATSVKDYPTRRRRTRLPSKAPNERNRLPLPAMVQIERQSRHVSKRPRHDLKRAAFSLSEARTIVGEFFTPRAWIYWTDLLVSWCLAITAYWAVSQATVPLAIRGMCFVVSCLLIYRCALFIHELVHLRAGTFRAFRFVWNVLCGIPFLIPSFVYYTHLDHHRRKHYGTRHDGEYMPLSGLPPWYILFYLSQCLVIPGLAIIRFGIMTPLTWLHPKIRDWVHARASSMIMDPLYIRPLPTRSTLRVIRLQELACFLYIAASAAAFLTGRVPWFVLGQAYATGVVVVTINALRTLGAHRWLNTDGGEMSFIEQMVDSVNYSRRPLISGLWAPVGLRFHALHHIFPTMPYHALATAHRRLLRELPSDSPYRLTEGESLFTSIGLLWRRAGQAHQRRRSIHVQALQSRCPK